MELESGDIALIDDFEYPIQDIKSEGIYIRNPDRTTSLLIYTDNKWHVQNDLREHRIQFTKREVQLTGIPEVDLNILINLNYETLINFCRKRLSPLCKSDYLWQKKVVYDFGQEIAMNKPIDETI